MKTIFRSALAVVVAVSTFAACSNDDTQIPVTPHEVEMTVVTSSDLDSSAPQSRTGFDPATGAVYWNQSGEYLKVFETADAKTTPKDSAEGVVTSNGTKASFGVSFPENTAATAFTYNAIYPASAWVTNSNTDITKLKVATPDTQSPVETSFDPAADLLIALPIETGTQPSELNMQFKRMVAIGKMTIKALASSDPITSIIFTAPGKKVTGRSYINLSEGTAIEYGYSGQSNDNLTLTFASDRNFTTDKQTYFTCFPFELTAGDTFTVTIKAGNKTFTKEVTLGEGRSLAFKAGESSTFTVNMSGIEGVETKTLDGDYVIVAKQNDVYYAMSSEADGSRLAAKTIEYDGISEKFATTDATIIWNIAKDGDNYTITNAKKFLSWVSGNGATTGDSSYALSITPNDDGTYKIGSVADTKRILAKNETPKYGFAFYTGTQTNNLLLIKVGEDTRTPLATPTLDEPAVEGNTITISWNTVEGAKDYTITYNDESVTTEDTIYELTDLSYNTEYSISIVANPTDTENFKASAASEPVTVTTETDPNAGQGDSVEFDFTQMGYSNGVEVTTIKKSPITITFDKGSSSNAPKYYTSGTAVRAYGGNTITISGANITKVEFTLGSESGSNNTINFDGTAITNNTWTGSASNVQFTVAGTSGNARIQKIVVTYGEGGGETPTPDPAIEVNPTSLSFAAAGETKTVTVIKTKADGCTIEASSDNTQFTASVEGTTVTVTAAENATTEKITGMLTISLMKDGAAVATATVALSQDAKSEGGETGDITAGKAWNHTFVSGQWNASPATWSNLSWNWVKEGSGTLQSVDGTKGQQWGSKSTPISSMTLTLKEADYKTYCESNTAYGISKIVVNTSGASGVDATLTVTVGGKALNPDSYKLTTAATNVEFTSDNVLTGDIVLKWTVSARAIYIKSISINN